MKDETGIQIARYLFAVFGLAFAVWLAWLVGSWFPRSDFSNWIGVDTTSREYIAGMFAGIFINEFIRWLWRSR